MIRIRPAAPGDGAVLWQTTRVDGIPDAAVREGERVERVSRDGVFTRVRTLAGATGWVESSELGGL